MSSTFFKSMKFEPFDKLFFFLVILYSVLQLVFPEIVLPGHLPGDADHYLNLFFNPDKVFITGDHDTRRILFLLVGLANEKFNFLDNFTTFFMIFNSICTFLSVFIWKKVMDNLEIQGTARLSSYFLIFVGFGLLKMNFYYPILPDTLIFLIGNLCLYFYLKRSHFLLTVAIFMGGLVRQEFLLFMIPLLFWPRESLPSPLSGKNNDKVAKYFLTFCAIALWAVCYVFLLGNYIGWKEFVSLNYILGTSVVLILFAYVFYHLLVGYDFISLLKNIQNIKLFLFLILLMALVSFVLPPEKPSLPLLEFMGKTFSGGVTIPFAFLISHFSYLGLAVVVLVACYRDVVPHIRKFGFGLVGTFFLGIVYLAETETRHSIGIYPFIMLPLVSYLNSIKFKPIEKFILPFVVILASNLWIGLFFRTNYEGLDMHYIYIKVFSISMEGDVSKAWILLYSIEFIIMWGIVKYLFRKDKSFA